MKHRHDPLETGAKRQQKISTAAMPQLLAVGALWVAALYLTGGIF
jgi:hypothetical protein